MTNDWLDSRFEVLRQLAVDAGRLTLQYFQQPTLTVEKKSDQSPVTVADRGAEEWLRKRIGELFPEDGILGEEFGESAGTNNLRWILDPIDGTKSFISGVPLYGTMVALESEGEALLGAVYVPGLDEGIFAGKGRGCWHFRGDDSPQAAKVGTRTSLSDTVFVTSEIKTFDRREGRGAYEALERECYITRTWGDCYGYMLVATGRADIMIDPIMSIWDAAAIQPIMQEAGGTFTDWRGNSTISAGEGIGTCPQLLEQVIAITSTYPPLKD